MNIQQNTVMIVISTINKTKKQKNLQMLMDAFAKSILVKMRHKTNLVLTHRKDKHADYSTIVFDKW